MFPGGELIQQGLIDLGRGDASEAALLVAIGAQRLRSAGLPVPESTPDDPEHSLYQLLAETGPDAAHSRYNALIRLLVSFERAFECAASDEARLRRFIEALGKAASDPGRVYLTGGATAVLMGWRESTVDADVLFEPDSDSLYRALPKLKEELELNVEIASPAHFIPELPGWRERSRWIAREGPIDFFHYDFYSQALAKIERGHAKDLADVSAMLERDLVEPERLRLLFDEIEPNLYRFLAIDPAGFRGRLSAALDGRD